MRSLWQLLKIMEPWAQTASSHSQISWMRVKPTWIGPQLFSNKILPQGSALANNRMIISFQEPSIWVHSSPRITMAKMKTWTFKKPPSRISRRFSGRSSPWHYLKTTVSQPIPPTSTPTPSWAPQAWLKTQSCRPTIKRAPFIPRESKPTPNNWVIISLRGVGHLRDLLLGFSRKRRI